MLTRLNRRSFCVFKKTRDPTKHFQMTQGPNRFSESWAWVGRIFLPKSLPQRSVNGQIESLTVKALYSYLTTINPSAQLDPSNYENDRQNSIGCLGVKPLSRNEFDEMMEHLRKGIILPMHRCRVNVEQELRKQVHVKLLIDFDLLTPMLAEEPIENFVKLYAELLESHVEVSHLYQPEGVIGSPGNLDVKPVVMLANEAKKENRRLGGNDLEWPRVENRTWVNSVMSHLHG